MRALTLDVADPASIEAAAERVREEQGRLDVLVNNAGVGSDFGVSGTAPDFDAMQRALDTNFFGAYRLTIALLGAAARERAPADRERVERHGRRGGDGRLVAGLPRVEGGDERDDPDPVDRAEGRGLPRQLGVPGLREHRHGRPDGREEAGGGRRQGGSCGWRRSPTTGRRAGSSATASRWRSERRRVGRVFFC